MPDDPATVFLADVRMQAEDHHLVPAGMVLPLVAALEAVLTLGDRSGETQDPHLPGHVDVYMIREAITAALTREAD